MADRETSSRSLKKGTSTIDTSEATVGSSSYRVRTRSQTRRQESKPTTSTVTSSSSSSLKEVEKLSSPCTQAERGSRKRPVGKAAASDPHTSRSGGTKKVRGYASSSQDSTVNHHLSSSSATTTTSSLSLSSQKSSQSSLSSSLKRRKDSTKVESLKEPPAKTSKKARVASSSTARSTSSASNSATSSRSQSRSHSTTGATSSSRRRSNRLTSRGPTATSSDSAATSSNHTNTKTTTTAMDENGREGPPPPSSATSPPNVVAPSSGASSGTGEDTDDSEMGRLQALLESRGLPPHIFGALGPRVQHLLHRSMGSSAGSKGQQLLHGLQASGDEGQQLQAVMEMCQLLVMGNEDTLAGFPVKQAVPALVSLLQMEHNFDIMNHAVRALTYMLESLPRSSVVVVEAIPVFLEKLQVIQCMDVAEQSLTALEMLSRRHSKNILHARGVAACLTYIDFFSINAQRAALAIAANCCQGLNAEEFQLVKDSIPLLYNHLNVQDKKCIESTCQAFARLVDSYHYDAGIITQIAGDQLLPNLQQLLLVSPQVISTTTFNSIIRMMTIMCSTCPALAVKLLKLNIAGTLRYLLLSPNSTEECLELASRSPQEFYEITSLIAELMPRLPRDGIFHVDGLPLTPQARIAVEGIWQWKDERGVWHSFDAADNRVLENSYSARDDEVTLTCMGQNLLIDFHTMTQINEDSGSSRPIQRKASVTGGSSSSSSDALSVESPDPRASFIKMETEAVESFVKSLFAVLYEVYSSSGGPAVRHKCLQALLRIIYFAPSELLQFVLRNQAVSRHIAAMLASPDLKIVVGALQMANILMDKLPDVFCIYFRREGVMHQMRRLVESDESRDSSNDPAPVSEDSLSVSDVAAAAAVPSSWGGNTSLSGAMSLSSSPSLTPEERPSCSGKMSRKAKSSRKSSSATSSSSSATTSSSKTKRNEPDNIRSFKSKSSAISTRSHSDCDVTEGADSPMAAAFSLPSTSQAAAAVAASASAAASGLHEVRSLLSSPAQAGSSSSARSRHTSRLGTAASKTGSFLASLNPSRWARGWGGASSSSSACTAVTSMPTGLSSYAHDHMSTASCRSLNVNRDKVKAWIKEQASAFETKYFSSTEDLSGAGNSHPAMNTLNRLSLAVESLNRMDSTSALEDIKSLILSSDISPFELIHSGIVHCLATFLTQEDNDSSGTTISRNERIRMFLAVFMGTSKTLLSVDEEKNLTTFDSSPFSALISKLNGCISQLEQFPVRVHDVIGTGTGNVRGTSALKFFNTHQLKCNLQRHPSCKNLKQWRGGPVKIDPLALVQAIERYLVIRGYGRIRDNEDDGSDDDNSDEEFDDNMAVILLGQGQGRHKLQFFIGEHPLPYNMTVYQAIRQFGTHNGNEPHELDLESDGPMANANMWVQTHQIYYKPYVEPNGEENSTTSSSGTSRSGQNKKGAKNGKHSPKRKDELWTEGKAPRPHSPVDQFLEASLPSSIGLSDASSDTIALLRVLHSISRYWGHFYSLCHPYKPAVPPQDFINMKLTAKANRQLQDPLVIMTGNLPPWLSSLANACPFLFPFETRHLLFYVTCFDRDRALQRLLDTTPGLNSSDSSERVTPRLDRRKKTVTRDDLIRQAEHVLQDVSSSKSLLEIQYEGEVGTGLGPTLEFYALVSQELQRADLEVWRGEAVTNTREVVISESGKQRPSSSAEIQASKTKADSKESPVKYAYSPHGLFPQPLGRNVKGNAVNKVKTKFKLLGKFMAKSLMDSRMLDIPLSVPFYKWMLNKDSQLMICDLEAVDPTLARTIFEMENIARRRKEVMADNENSDLSKVKVLSLDGCAIEDLGLDFTLPGFPSIEMKKNGRDTNVTLDNIEQYVSLLVHWTLVEGVQRQMEAFREGFESVFPLSNLKLFYPEELEHLFCGSGHSRWDLKSLTECCHADHGYSMESRAIQYLFQILCEYDIDEQRSFLQFVTGSPRLPVGGLRSLSPPLTIVRKTCENGDSPDIYLPSVMTCVNYLKLPDYSSIDIMRSKLRVAAREGQNSFHLS